MEHLKKKIETYKSNTGAKWCNTSCKGQRDQKETDSVHKMLQQPQIKVWDEHTARMHPRGGAIQITPLGLWALISGLLPTHSSAFGKLPHLPCKMREAIKPYSSGLVKNTQ